MKKIYTRFSPQLTTLKERRERGNLIIIYEFMNNQDETNEIYYLIMRKKRRGQICERIQEKKIAKRNLLEQQKKYLDWPEEQVIMAKNV